jgi:hypothetical protein
MRWCSQILRLQRRLSDTKTNRARFVYERFSPESPAYAGLFYMNPNPRLTRPKA